MYPLHRTLGLTAEPLRLTASEPATRAALDWADNRGGVPQILVKHADTPFVWDGGVLCAPTVGGGFITVELVALEQRLTIRLCRAEDDESDLSILTVPRHVFAGGPN